MVGEDNTSIGSRAGQVKHAFKMYSLRKFYVGEDDEPTYSSGTVVTPKLDGAAIALTYVDGELVQVATRGNGEYGEDLNHLFSLDQCHRVDIVTDIDILGVVQITGEIVAPKTIPNARNYAAGALSLKSVDEFAQRGIRFVAYDLQGTDILDHYSFYLDKLNDLFTLGFVTVQSVPEDLYPTDGYVVRVANEEEYQKLGYTSKFPRGAYALKERTEGLETVIVDVIWQTGKSGKVSPIALLDPITIDGAVVSRATLNNFGFIQALDLSIGDRVMVERAGGIIPRIIRKVGEEKNNS